MFLLGCCFSGHEVVQHQPEVIQQMVAAVDEHGVVHEAGAFVVSGS